MVLVTILIITIRRLVLICSLYFSFLGLCAEKKLNQSRDALWNAESMKYECPSCDKSYKNWSCLRKHVAYVCGKTPRYKCYMCPYSSHTKAGLIYHIKNFIHKNNDWYYIRICNNKSITFSDVRFFKPTPNRSY